MFGPLLEVVQIIAAAAIQSVSATGEKDVFHKIAVNVLFGSFTGACILQQCFEGVSCRAAQERAT